MAFSDEIDYDEHRSVEAQVADERRSERGRRITIVIEWERPASDLWSDEDYANDLRDTLVSVAELGAQFQENSMVTSKIEQLGDDE